MSFLSSISHWLVETLEPYGAPGLMLIAIGDSSFLSLPEVNDAALMALSINNPVRMWELAAMTVLGSVIGCSLLYAIGRRGGESLLARRFASHKVERVRAWYQRFGMLAVIVPSLLPPPLPFKIFVLTAGAFRVPWPQFIVAVAIGRSLRYFSEGLLAVRYGAQAMKIVEDNFAIVGIALAGAIVAATVIFLLVRRRRNNGRAVMLPLLIMIFGGGCIRIQKLPPSAVPLPSLSFSHQQALGKLEQLSRDVQSLKGSIRLSGSTLKPGTTDTIMKPAVSINGFVFINRPKFYLQGSKVLSLFEMVSDGTRYQIFSNQEDKLYTDGMEQGPAYKKFAGAGDLVNQLINIRPGKIQEALLIDVSGVIRDEKILPLFSEETVREPDQARHCLVLQFLEVTGKEARPVQTFWFDLATTDVWKRKTFSKTGTEDTEVLYTGYESVSPSMRYPSKISLHFASTDTWVYIALDPKNMKFNDPANEKYFALDTHSDAKKVFKFEPLENGPVTQQQ